MSSLSSYFKPELDRSGQYNRKDALAFAVACQLAYDSSLIYNDPRIPEWGFGSIIPFSKSLGINIDTQGFIAEYQDRIIITFRGSSSLPDWLTNFNVFTAPSPFVRGRVHQGFQNALFPVLIKILSSVQNIDPHRQKDIWVTGHSLGGALAVLLVAMLIEDGVHVRGLYTFGAPRVGDRDFADSFSEKFIRTMGGVTYRVVNEGDLIPHLLPEFLNFHHTQNRMLFDEYGQRKDQESTWVNFKESMGAWMSHIGKKDLAIADYHMLGSNNGYLKKLKNDLGLV